MLASFGAGLIKLRKRPSTWVLGLIWLAAIVLLNYALTYAFLSSAPPPTFPEGTPKEQQEQFQRQQRMYRFSAAHRHLSRVSVP